LIDVCAPNEAAGAHIVDAEVWGGLVNYRELIHVMDSTGKWEP
jgi:hypothetical protein